MLQGLVQKTIRCFIWGLFLIHNKTETKYESLSYLFGFLHGFVLCFHRRSMSSQVKSQYLQACIVWSSSICMFKLFTSLNVLSHFSHLNSSSACLAFIWTFKPVSLFAMEVHFSHFTWDEMSISCYFSSWCLPFSIRYSITESFSALDFSMSSICCRMFFLWDELSIVNIKFIIKMKRANCKIISEG